MRRLLLVLVSILALSTAASAQSMETRNYVGCPRHIPGCPGYTATHNTQISTSGPVTISGNPKATKGHWGERRSYIDSCYWDVDEGLSCMKAARVPRFQPKRLRREEMIQMQSDTLEREQAPDDMERITETPGTISGRLGGRFAWRGHSRTLRDIYD